MQKIAPFLWFNNQAEEAANFYTSIFKNSGIKNVSRYGDAGPGPKGQVMVVSFEIQGQEFMALNGGPSPMGAPAFYVNCDTQEEVDELWERLSEGGKKNRCGWLTDRFGVSWNIVPAVLPKLISDPDPAKSKRVMEAMLKMEKLDIGELERAAAA